MKTPLIIVGTGDYADVAFQYLQLEGTFDVKGFSEEREYIKKANFNDLPIYEFERLSTVGMECKVLVAVGPNRINTVRQRLFKEVKAMGFNCIRHIHPQASVWDHEAVGENSFVFPGCVVEPFATVGNNCVMWSGSVLSHHSAIQDHCFVAPGCKISGRVVIKNNCFLGINSTIRDNITVEEKTIVGAGAIIKKNTSPGSVMSAKGTPLWNNDSFSTHV